MKKIAFLFLVSMSVLSLQNCKEDSPCKEPTDPKCPNYDPCYGKKPVSADFQIGMTGNPGSINKFSDMFEEDTLFPKAAIRFRAKTKGAKYIWKLGSETIYDSAFTRTFYNAPFGRYAVTLIIEKDPDLACFPGDDGKDTLTRYFYIIERCKLQSTGSYKGVWEGKKDSFIFKISHMYRQTQSYWDTCNNFEFVIINSRNYNISQDTIDSWDVKQSITGNNFCMFRAGISEMINGEFRINPLTKKIRFDYTYNHGDHHVIFNGRKL